VDHVDGRGVVGLVDQDGQLVVGKGHILDGGRGVGPALSSVTVVVLGNLRWRGEVDDWWFFSRVHDRSPILNLLLLLWLLVAVSWVRVVAAVAVSPAVRHCRRYQQPHHE